MVINICDSVNAAMFLTKRNIDTFDVLTFIQMRIDKKRGCVQVRRDFDK